MASQRSALGSRRAWWAIASVLLAVSVGGSAAAQPADHRNAAFWYQKAITQYQRLSENQRLLLLQYDLAAGPPTPEVRSALAGVQGILANLKRGAAQDYCDFGIDHSQGLELALPHLNQLRSITRLASADAIARLHDGDGTGAADRIASLYRLGGHTSEDRIVISSLVGQAISGLADAVSQHALDRGALSAADSAKLVSAIDSIGLNDPFGYGEAMAGEHQMGIATLEHLRDEFNTEQFAEMVGLPGDPAIVGLSNQEIDDAIDQYDQMMNQVVEIFANPDQQEAQLLLAAWEKDVVDGKYGVLARVLAPAYTKVFERKLLAQQAMQARMDVLGQLAAGELKPEEAANAALWYRRAIELLEKIDPARLSEMRALADDTAVPIEEPLMSTLSGVSVQEIIDIAREGSQKKRCDFAQPLTYSPPRIAPQYSPGMHDLLRLLRADSVRLLRSGQTSNAAERLTVAFRVIGHLGSDPQLVSALSAHRSFNRILALIDSALKINMLADDDKHQLLEAVERITRKDPFGYVAAVLATRSRLAANMREYFRQTDNHQNRHEQDQAIKGCGGDQLLFILAVLEADEHANVRKATAKAGLPAEEPGLDEPPDPLVVVLDDVLSAEGLQVARDIAPGIAARLAEGDVDALLSDDHEPIAAPTEGQTFSDWMQRARRDLRWAHILLKPAPKPKDPVAQSAPGSP